MKYIVVVILAGLVALPIVSGVLYGFDWGIYTWFGLIGFLGLVVIFVNKFKGTKPF